MAYYNQWSNQLLDGPSTVEAFTSPQFTRQIYSTNTTAGTAVDLRWGNSQNTSADTWTTFDYHLAANTGGTASARLTNSQNMQWRVAGFSGIGQLKNALMKIFEEVPKNLIKSKDDKILVKAKEKSEKLLKEWLSPAEYEGLKKNGEIEIPSRQDEDVIFIVKKDPNQMVNVKKKDKITHKLCRWTVATSGVFESD